MANNQGLILYISLLEKISSPFPARRHLELRAPVPLKLGLGWRPVSKLYSRELSLRGHRRQGDNYFCPKDGHVIIQGRKRGPVSSL